MQIATQYYFCVAVFAMHFFQVNSGPDRQIVEQSNPLKMYDQSNKIKCNGW